jgi:isocitrate dehydrogenase
MWNAEGKLQDTSPSSPTAATPACTRGPTSAAARRLRSAHHGFVPNVGLMAQAAEEYGSHDKTFQIPAAARSA